MRIRSSRGALIALAGALVMAASPNLAMAGGIPAGQSSSDFDGDGFEDLATSAIYTGEFNGAGSVTVLPGDGTGLVTAGASFWTQDSDGLGDTRQRGDAFGSFLEGVDFDDDGFDDLVVGVQGEDVKGRFDAGGFHVIPGSASGLTSAGSMFITRETGGVVGVPGAGDNLGWWFSAGDFDGDGSPDLAAAAPFDDVDHERGAGSVQVFWGSAAGLTTDSEIITEATGGVPGKVGSGDWFGFSTTAGDLNDDGIDDLVIGSDDKYAGGYRGSVTVIPGGATGLDYGATARLTEDSPGVPGRADPGDGFGRTVASGDVDADGIDDLAIGAEGDSNFKGSLTTMFGSPASVTTDGIQRWTPKSLALPEPRSSAHLGFAISIVDLNDDTFGDIVAGMPLVEINGKDEAGAMFVLPGSAGGSTMTGSQYWNQASPGIPSAPESNGTRARGDAFGFFTRGRDINGDGFQDLLISVPGEDDEAGALQVLLGSAAGLTTTGQQFLTQDDEGVPGVKNDFDNWGTYIG